MPTRQAGSALKNSTTWNDHPNGTSLPGAGAVHHITTSARPDTVNEGRIALKIVKLS